MCELQRWSNIWLKSDDEIRCKTVGFSLTGWRQTAVHSGKSQIWQQTGVCNDQSWAEPTHTHRQRHKQRGKHTVVHRKHTHTHIRGLQGPSGTTDMTVTSKHSSITVFLAKVTWGSSNNSVHNEVYCWILQVFDLMTDYAACSLFKPTFLINPFTPEWDKVSRWHTVLMLNSRSVTHKDIRLVWLIGAVC